MTAFDRFDRMTEKAGDALCVFGHIRQIQPIGCQAKTQSQGRMTLDTKISQRTVGFALSSRVHSKKHRVL